MTQRPASPFPFFNLLLYRSTGQRRLDGREDGVAVAYYVHYSELNKRLDAWVPVEDVETRKEGEGEGKGEGGDGRGGDGDGGGAGSADDALGAHGRVNGKQPKTLTRNSKRRYNEIHNVDAPVEDLPPMDQMFERMHEEKTKVKNVHSIELGRRAGRRGAKRAERRVGFRGPRARDHRRKTGAPLRGGGD